MSSALEDQGRHNKSGSWGKLQRGGYLGQEVWEEEGKLRGKCPALLAAVIVCGVQGERSRIEAGRVGQLTRLPKKGSLSVLSKILS